MSTEISGISLDTMQQMQRMMMYSSAIGGTGTDFSSIFTTALMMQMMSEMQDTMKSKGAESTSSGEDSAKSSTEKAGTSNTASVSDADKLKEIFERASERFNISEQLLLAVAKAESSFDVSALSNAGAMGVMQLMPLTAEGLGVTDAYDPEQNIMAGAELLAGYLSDYNGDTELALAAYNAGPGNVKTYGGVPPFAETLNYIERVNRYLDEGISIPGASADGNEKTAENAGVEESKSASSGMDDMMKTMTKMMEYQLEYSMLNMQMNMLNTGTSGIL